MLTVMLLQVRRLYPQVHVAVLSSIREGLHHLQYLRRTIMPRQLPRSIRRVGT